MIPNYIDYPNAYFFMFNERKQGVFSRDIHEGLLEKYLRTAKKFVVVSNTEEENFKRILSRHTLKDDHAESLFLAAKDFDKGGVKGGLMESIQAKTMLGDFIKKCK